MAMEEAAESMAEGGATRWTVYDGNSPVLDFNGSGTQTARYLNGPTPAGVDAVLAREVSGTVAWYLQDRLGSVGDLVDNTGALIDHMAYSAFGKVVSESSPATGDRFKYEGLEYDAATGLNFALHRVEDAATGRWLSQDPIGFRGEDVDIYRYVGNKPADSIDPGGLLTISIGVGGELIIGIIRIPISIEIGIGVSPSQGLTGGVIATGGAQPALGAGAGAGFTGSVTTASTIKDLGGSSICIGVSTPLIGGDFITSTSSSSSPYWGVGGSWSPWPNPVVGVHAGDLQSCVWQPLGGPPSKPKSTKPEPPLPPWQKHLPGNGPGPTSFPTPGPFPGYPGLP